MAESGVVAILRDAALRRLLRMRPERERRHMRYIDAYNHFFPKRYFDALMAQPGDAKDVGKRVLGIPALWELDRRLQVVEQFENYTPVLSHGLPPVEKLFGPDKSPEMAKIANDGL